MYEVMMNHGRQLAQGFHEDRLQEAAIHRLIREARADHPVFIERVLKKLREFSAHLSINKWKEQAKSVTP